MDWQILYSLRIVRVLAIFKLARFNETAASFKKAFYLIRDEFFLFFSVILFMLYVTSLGIYIAEHEAKKWLGNDDYRAFPDVHCRSIIAISLWSENDAPPRRRS